MTAAQISTRRDELELALRQELPISMRHADLAVLTDQELVGGRRMLAALRTECGCRAGEFTMIAALAVALGHIALGHGSSTAAGVVAAVGEVVLALVAGGGIGKAAGILTARIRYVHRSRHLVGGQR